MACDNYTSEENCSAPAVGMWPCRRCGEPEKDHPWETWTADTKIRLTPLRNALRQKQIRFLSRNKWEPYTGSPPPEPVPRDEPWWKSPIRWWQLPIIGFFWGIGRGLAEAFL